MVPKVFVLGFLACISLTESAPLQQKRSLGGLGGWGAPVIQPWSGHNLGLGVHGLGLSRPIVQTIQTIQLPTIKATYSVPIKTIPTIGSIGHIPSISSIPSIGSIGHLPSISSIGHLPSISTIESIAPIESVHSIPIESDISLLGGSSLIAGHIGSPAFIDSGFIGHGSPIISSGLSGHGLIGGGIIGGGIIKGGVIGGHGVYGGSSIW